MALCLGAASGALLVRASLPLGLLPAVVASGCVLGVIVFGGMHRAIPVEELANPTPLETPPN
jgi:hypothetical protein